MGLQISQAPLTADVAADMLMSRSHGLSATHAVSTFAHKGSEYEPRNAQTRDLGLVVS